MFDRIRTIIATLVLVPAVLLMGACTPAQQFVASTATTPVCTRTAVDEKTLYAAEASYNIIAQAYVSANSHGLLKPDVKAQVKPLVQKAYAYLKGARAAYQVCNSATLLSYQGAIDQIKTQILPLIPHSA